MDNGTWASIVYDSEGRITFVSNFYLDNSLISRFTYSYDPAGNRTGQRREDGALWSWKYDPTNQLTSEFRDDGVTATTTTYVYDPLGNRLALNEEGQLTTSTYDAANRLQTSEDAGGVTNYTFDSNGNQQVVETPLGDVTTYSWSYENQLIQLEKPDDTVTTYQYAPVTKLSDELRVSKVTDMGTVNFIWDNQNIIREIDETGTVEAEYTLNPQPYGNLVSQHRGAESSFYNFDALGSTESLTDPSATQTDSYAYTVFGGIAAQSGTTENNFTWIGELGYFQDEPGSYSARQRIYESEIFRFLSQDPLGFGAGDDNLYRYVGNNPVLRTDPSGLDDALVSVPLHYGSTVYWVGYKSGWFEDTQCAQVAVGSIVPSMGFTRRGDRLEVKLYDEFGGCTVELGQIRDLAANTPNDHLCKLSPGARRNYVKWQIKEHLCQGLPNFGQPSPSVCTAAVCGASEGATVWIDELTFHFVCHEASLQIQESAIQRGDVGSQIGFGCGKISAHALHAIGFIKGVGLAARGLGAATGASAEAVQSGVTYTVKLTAPISVPYFGYSAAKNTCGAIGAAREGNWISATELAGVAGLDAIFAVDITKLATSGLANEIFLEPPAGESLRFPGRTLCQPEFMGTCTGVPAVTPPPGEIGLAELEQLGFLAGRSIAEVEAVRIATAPECPPPTCRSRCHPVDLSTAGRTAEEAAAIRDYARRANKWLEEHGTQTIQCTQGNLRKAASAAARAERLRAQRAGRPYGSCQAGHVPDTAVTGHAVPPAGWIPMPGSTNQAVGGVLGSRVGECIDHYTVDGVIP